MNIDIEKAGGILIKDKKFLVERSKDKEFFVAPGGKIEEGETPKQALIRELKEEFNINVTEDNFTPFGEFVAQAAGQKNKVLKMYVFIVDRWEGEPTPSSEVEELLWIDTKNIGKIKVGSIFAHEVMPRLKEKRLID